MDTGSNIKIVHFRDVFGGGATGRIKIIKGGVYAQDVARIAQSMDRSKEQISKTLGLAVSTVDRKAKANERLSAEQGERVVGLAKLIGQVETMVEESGDPSGFDAAQWLARWLDRPLPALGGKRPAEYMDTAEGRELVSQLLAMTQSGAYA
jgi:putative toxin-antitoxin system antitoxin component (TIGR02293 family)